MQKTDKKKLQQDDLRPYRMGGLPLLLFMALLGIGALVVVVALKYFFNW